MLITFLKNLKKIKISKRSILILGIILLIIAVVIWQSLFVKEKAALPGEVWQPSKRIEINFEILESPILRALQPFEEVKPIEEGAQIGRENPFIPY